MRFVFSAIKISSALLRTKPHLIPILFPLFTPCEWPVTRSAGFSGEIGFFTCFGMGQDRLNVESRKSRALFSRVIPYSRSFCQNDPTRFQHPTTRRDVDPSPLAKGAWNTGFTNDLWNSAPLSLAAPAKPLVGFNGMIFTWLSMPCKSATNFSAVSSESFFPAIKVHSKRSVCQSYHSKFCKLGSSFPDSISYWLAPMRNALLRWSHVG